MLIVIDDVWQAAHARPFLQAGPNCARLITTRNRDALPPKAKALDVDAMKATEAVSFAASASRTARTLAFARFAQPPGQMAAALEARERRAAQTPCRL